LGRRYSIDLLGAYRSSSRGRSLQPLPGAVAHFQRAMMMDVDQAAKAMRDEELQAEIEDFIEGFNQPTCRGMRVNGVRVARPGHPSTGGQGIPGRMRSGSSCTTEISLSFTGG
jgi:hypothetical protein